MRSVFENFEGKINDYGLLQNACKVYSEKKVMEWLEMRPAFNNCGMSDYQWVIHCAKWEVATYGEIRYEKHHRPRTNENLVAVSG